MNKKNTKIVALGALYFAFFIVLGTPVRVKAYVDPATLTYVIQIVAGLFIAGGVAIGVYWRKIKKAFTKKKDDKPETVVSAEDRAAAADAAAAAMEADKND